MISIIIPTLNEEKYLPKLLESIKGQSFSDYEIIVADAGSTDGTGAIAQKYNCKIVPGGLPAEGKNKGAKAAKGDLLLFLDADVVLPEKFFDKALTEFKKRKIDIAGMQLLPDGKNKIYHMVFNIFYNFPATMSEKFLPHSSAGILVEKDIFEKLNGFDETIKLAEDHDLSRRAQKEGEFGFLRSAKIYISDRRFEKDGWIRTAAKYFLCELHMIFKGPVRSDIFDYKYGHYCEDKKNKL